jgi:hypothetical protein|tara:strand:- start:4569 stop:5357 length:789 start_codon:yes stop_codon:yes gene_type:complete
MGMMIHCGGKAVDYLDLLTYEPPKATKSYQPVGHYDLVTMACKIANDMLKDYRFDHAKYAVAKEGNRMFGMLTYRSNDIDPHEVPTTNNSKYKDRDRSADLGLNIAIRNSYDKSMSVGMVMGATVFVCDNLALTGEIVIMRKHTTNVWEDLKDSMITTIYKSQTNFPKIQEDANRMKNINITDDQAYEYMGLLYGHGLLRPRQLNHAISEWKEPSYTAFQDSKNVWTLYNSITDSLKSTPPDKIMQKHLDLHDETTKRFAIA